jgi:hypothetical protein
MSLNIRTEKVVLVGGDVTVRAKDENMGRPKDNKFTTSQALRKPK